MSSTPSDFTRRQNIGIAVFVATAGITALEQGGFGFGLKLGLPIYLAISALGGAIGGALMAKECPWAGSIGGAIAGPCGLLVLVWYVQGRAKVYHLELVVVQMIAGLPGFGVYYLLQKLSSKPAPVPTEESMAA